MYQVGELIVYGGTGVCRVEAVETPQQRGPEAEALIDAIPGMHAEACHERNFTQLAARFMKRAETLLYGELSVAWASPSRRSSPTSPAA